MALLIDGYNLLHAAGMVARGPASLEKSRLALLNFLAESLPPAERQQTTVVFDAAQAPPGLPDRCEHRGLKVLFARGYDDADALVEELIRSDSSPRRLTVVSSDHRLHKAASRRRARAIDSDLWFGQTLRQRSARHQAAPTNQDKPPLAALDEEIAYWLRHFTTTLRDEASTLPDAAAGELESTSRPVAPTAAVPPRRHESAPRPPRNARQPGVGPTASPPPRRRGGRPRRVTGKPPRIDSDPLFPPGFADDLLGGDVA